MKRVLAFLVVVALVAPAALADDLIAPPWERGAPGTTFQEWDSWETIGSGTYVADNYDNDYGIPYIVDPYEAGVVYAEYLGRQDVMVIDDGSWLEMYIDNTPDAGPDTWKDIYLQITWHWDGTPDIPDVWYPSTGSTIEITDEWYFDDPEGWWYTRYHIHIEPNPDQEEIDFWPADGWNLVIDQIVVDTICIPEPASLALFAFGGLALLRRKR